MTVVRSHHGVLVSAGARGGRALGRQVLTLVVDPGVETGSDCHAIPEAESSVSLVPTPGLAVALTTCAGTRADLGIPCDPAHSCRCRPQP